MGPLPSSPDSASEALQGLEALRHQELQILARALHDDIGPSLCSAGLMLGLLRSSWLELPQDTRDMLDSIQDALETSVDSVRLLSYLANPALAARCGLRGALDHLARYRPLDIDYGLAPPTFSNDEAETLVRLVRLALDRANGPCRLSLGSSALTLSGPFSFSPSEARALALLAHQAGLELQPLLEGRLALARPNPSQDPL